MLTKPISIGGVGIWVSATYAFITDISRPDQAAFRLGMLHIASKIAAPIGPPIGAAIFQKGVFTYLVWNVNKTI